MEVKFVVIESGTDRVCYLASTREDAEDTAAMLARINQASRGQWRVPPVTYTVKPVKEI